MIDYTWKYPASEETIETAKAQARELVDSADDGQHEVQVLLQAFDLLCSDDEADVEFGREVFRIFREEIM